MKWQYHIERFHGRYQEEDIQARLTDLGEQGWELISIEQDHLDYSKLAHFKRPKTDASEG